MRCWMVAGGRPSSVPVARRGRRFGIPRRATVRCRRSKRVAPRLPSTLFDPASDQVNYLFGHFPIGRQFPPRDRDHPARTLENPVLAGDRRGRLGRVTVEQGAHTGPGGDHVADLEPGVREDRIRGAEQVGDVLRCSMDLGRIARIIGVRGPYIGQIAPGQDEHDPPVDGGEAGDCAGVADAGAADDDMGAGRWDGGAAPRWDLPCARS